MAEETQTKKHLSRQTERDYRAVEERIAPFVIPKPTKQPLSTAGQWRARSKSVRRAPKQ